MLKTLQGAATPGLIVALLIGLAMISARTLGQDSGIAPGDVALADIVRSVLSS